MPAASIFQHAGRGSGIRIGKTFGENRAFTHFVERFPAVFANGQSGRIGVRNRYAARPTAVIKENGITISNGAAWHNPMFVESPRLAQRKYWSLANTKDLCRIIN